MAGVPATETTAASRRIPTGAISSCSASISTARPAAASGRATRPAGPRSWRASCTTWGGVRRRVDETRRRMVTRGWALPGDLDAAVRASLEEWRATGKLRRLWARDASLWTGEDEAAWLGWLGVTDDPRAHLPRLRMFAEEVRAAGFAHTLLMGMGGSSLCPEVLRGAFGRIPGFPELAVLDSTDPARIRALERAIDPARTLFIVSSKSGSTLEPNIFKQYFFERVKQALGAGEAGQRFIAITDPGSKLQRVAENDRFLRIFFGLPSIGGRYSALSDFGMVPAAVMGIDVAAFLDRADRMARACAPGVPPAENPGVVLGTILGVLGRRGRDKVTIVASPGVAGFGAWLEQLLAESTGKQGKGLIPVDGERLGPPGLYGGDRLFVYVRLEPGPDPAQDAALEALARAGQPVVRISLADPYDLAAEFFRWEIATAVAGSILGINPFASYSAVKVRVAILLASTSGWSKGLMPR